MDPWDAFDASATTRSALVWARSYGATTLGEAYDLLDQLEAGNDVPEVLGEDGTVDEVRAEVEDGLAALGPDASLDDVL